MEEEEEEKEEEDDDDDDVVDDDDNDEEEVIGKMSISSSSPGRVEVRNEGSRKMNVLPRVKDDGYVGGLARGKVLGKSNVSISYQTVFWGPGS